MWKILAILSLAFALAESKSAIAPSIVGGSDAALGQFPYFMSIRYGAALSHGCGSGILNVRFAITVSGLFSVMSYELLLTDIFTQAAHCLNGGERAAVAGAIRLVDPGVRFDIIRSIPHPDFHPVLLWNE
jgi:secreted trypsin-like serine protease